MVNAGRKGKNQYFGFRLRGDYHTVRITASSDLHLTLDRPVPGGLGLGVVVVRSMTLPPVRKIQNIEPLCFEMFWSQIAL